MSRRTGLRSGLKRISNWLRRHGRSWRTSLDARNSAFAAAVPRVAYDGWNGASCTGGKLADITDFDNPAFGAALRDRLPGRGDTRHPRKLWELSWIAQRFEELGLAGGDMLGLGVGQEPLIYHFAHRARSVVATDLYSGDTAWREARLAADQIFEASPFPYPRERLSVKNMDMRSIDAPDGSVDVVWSCSSVEHVQTLPQLVQVFREIHRILKPGGVALITTEFSVGDPYFLPGVLSLWSGSGLFDGKYRGLTLVGPVSTQYRHDVPGNRPTPRRDVIRSALLNDFAGGPTGLCIHVGYTQTIPIAMAFRKTGPTFAWREHLGAPAWYVPFATGVEIFNDKQRAAEAAVFFGKSLDLADTRGARLHCFRALIEARVHAGQVAELQETLRGCQAVSLDFPDDDDALDLIGFVAAGAGHLPFARRCWEKAASSPSALPASKLRIRLNQLDAEFRTSGLDSEARHLYHLAEAAHWEALDFLGAQDIFFQQLDAQFKCLRDRLGVAHPLTAVPPPS